MTAEEKLLNAGYDDILYLTNYSYDDALIGVSEDGRAVYDYDKMVEYLIEKENWSYDEATDWVHYNTIRSLSYMGEGAPIIMYRLEYLE